MYIFLSCRLPLLRRCTRAILIGLLATRTRSVVVDGALAPITGAVACRGGALARIRTSGRVHGSCILLVTDCCLDEARRSCSLLYTWLLLCVEVCFAMPVLQTSLLPTHPPFRPDCWSCLHTAQMDKYNTRNWMRVRVRVRVRVFICTLDVPRN